MAWEIVLLVALLPLLVACRSNQLEPMNVRMVAQGLLVACNSLKKKYAQVVLFDSRQRFLPDKNHSTPTRAILARP